MPTPETAVVLGDEHVAPISSVWSAAPAAVATRPSPQECGSLGDAMWWALTNLGVAQPKVRSWGGRQDGYVLSLACARAFVKANKS